MTPLELVLPFAGRWLVQNSPGRRVPSHGVDVLGRRYAIDLVGVVHVHDGEVTVGQQLATCGSSGNSTEPHVRLQAMDRQDVATAQGLPIVFRAFREHPPGQRSVVEPL